MSQPSRVLLIDDDFRLARAIVIRLEANGYAVVHAPDGRSGLDVAASTKPDLILTDIRMPDIDGFEVCRRLMNDESLADIPVICCSASVQDHVRRQAASLGVAAFIHKPFEASELIGTIQTVLDKPRTQHGVG